MLVVLTELLQEISRKWPGAHLLEPSPVRGYPCVNLSSKAEVVPVAAYLKDKKFEYLDFVTAVDWKGAVSLDGFIRDPNPNPFLPEGAVPQVLPKPVAGFPYRDAFEVVWAFSNWESRIKLFVRLEIGRMDSNVPSLAHLYKTADWQEREIFDMFGIIFEGHPDLKRILTPDCIQGHPLRKDYAHVKDKYD